MKYQAIIFDFDGTIADSISVMFDVLNKTLPKYGIHPIPLHELERLRNMTIHDIFKHIHLSRWQLLLIVNETRLRMHHVLSSIQPYPGMKEVISALHKANVPIYIASSNSIRNIKKYLELHDIEGVHQVFGNISIYNKHKALTRLIHRIQTSSGSTNPLLYVGDEVRDIEAVRAVKGLHIASVTWGLNTAGLLKSYNPDYLCTSPNLLLSICGLHSLQSQLR